VYLIRQRSPIYLLERVNLPLDHVHHNFTSRFPNEVILYDEKNINELLNDPYTRYNIKFVSDVWQ